MKVCLTSYAALFLSVYFTDLSKRVKLKEGSKGHILLFILTEIMKALKITEMTKIVFFKGFPLSMTLHLSKCARN